MKKNTATAADWTTGDGNVEEDEIQMKVNTFTSGCQA